MLFHDRKEAGKKLLEKLSHYRDDPNALVLALPRGGVVTAFEIAMGLHLPLDIVVPRKIGAPGNPELAIGAITEDGQGILQSEIIEAYGISPEYISKAIEIEKKEARRRLELYRGDLPPLDLTDKNVLLVDDGIATAATMRAAIASVKAKHPLKVIVAAPVAAPDALEKIHQEADEVVVLDAPFLFMAVSQFYERFPQTTDEEVITLMWKAHKKTSNAL